MFLIANLPAGEARLPIGNCQLIPEGLFYDVEKFSFKSYICQLIRKGYSHHYHNPQYLIHEKIVTIIGRPDCIC